MAVAIGAASKEEEAAAREDERGDYPSRGCVLQHSSSRVGSVGSYFLLPFANVVRDFFLHIMCS